MNIYTPAFMERNTIPRQLLEAIDSHGSLADFQRRSAAATNLPHQVNALLSRPTRLAELKDCNVTVIDAVSFNALCREYRISNILDAITVCVSYDVVGKQPHIVVPSTFLEESADSLDYFETAMLHETVHVDQINRGDLVIDAAGGRFIWKGEEMRIAGLATQAEYLLAEYRERYPDMPEGLMVMMAEMETKPWELEAYYRMFEHMCVLDTLPEPVFKILNTYQK